ncbi:M81 family metallopeptidase [Roseivivax sp. CAU 1761]
MRVALAGFLHETNTFAPDPAGMEAFRQGGGYIPMSRGAALPEAAAGVNLGISGALDVARERGWDIVPILWAGAIPSAPVTRDAFETIAAEIVAGLAAAGPLDGVFLDLHGAMVAEHVEDGEAEIARRVRDAVGPGVPVAAALDLHGNIGADFVAAVDAAVGFRTYPHVDMAETGRRAADLLDEMMRSGRRPAKAFARLPYLVPIPLQSTDIAPADELYAELARIEAGGVRSASLFMGFPAADIPECGPTAMAFADDAEAAEAAVSRIARAYAEAEPRFAGRTYDAAEAVAEAQRLSGPGGPVILADTQDNPGAGGVSATTGLLGALIAAGARDAALGLIVDPAAAARAHELGEGGQARFRLGGHARLGAPPLEAEAVVERLSDGRFRATGPYYGGTAMDLGPSACLRIGGVRVAVTSRIAQMADREMFRFLGIDSEAQAILAVKSSTHFRADFAPIARAILIALAPGPMPFDPAELPFTRLAPGLRLSPGGPAFAAPSRAAAAAAP